MADCTTSLSAADAPPCDLAPGGVIHFTLSEPPMPPVESAPVAPTAPVEPAAPAEPVAPVAPVAAEPVAVAPAAPVTVATTEQAATPSADDLGKLANSTGGGSMGLILAILAVVGGGAAWKTYQRFSEQKHEQAMKKLELDAKAQGLAGAQPPPCAVKQSETDAKLVSFDARIAAVEKKSASLSADFDADDLERRVKKLEKLVKALGDEA